jgi:hypothetical protein
MKWVCDVENVVFFRFFENECDVNESSGVMYKLLKTYKNFVLLFAKGQTLHARGTLYLFTRDWPIGKWQDSGKRWPLVNPIYKSTPYHD